METIGSINRITTNPKVRGGRPCISGTSLRVTDLVMASLYHNRTPSEIASDYAISLAQAHAALAHYYEHKETMDEDIRQQIATAKAYKEQRLGRDKPSLLSG